MPRLLLAVTQFNPAARRALIDLHEALPDPMTAQVCTDSGKFQASVTYPDQMSEADARTRVRAALDALPRSGGVSLPDADS